MNGALIVGDYRYRLWRELTRGFLDRGEEKSIIVFVMLNPSTADHTQDDVTIRKCRRIAFEKVRVNADRFMVVNLYALRSTDPRKLDRHADPIGPDNDAHLLEVCKKAKVVIVAWGNQGHRRRGPEVAKRLIREGIKLHCLKLTDKGAPSHPARLPYASMSIMRYRP